MKSSTKIIIGVVVVALIGAGVYFGGSTRLFKGSLAPQLEVSAPKISIPKTASSKLNNGQNDIAAVQIQAPADKNISLKRITFKFQSKGATVYGLDVIKKIGAGTESYYNSQISIQNGAYQDLKVGPADIKLSTADKDQNDFIYITWNDQEFIQKGVTNTYIVRATVVEAKNKSFTNTYALGDGTSFYGKKDVNSLLNSGYKFIWSDLSDPRHSISTSDWLNGANSIVSNLPTQPSLKLTW